MAEGTKVGGVYFTLDLDDKKFKSGLNTAGSKMGAFGKKLGSGLVQSAKLATVAIAAVGAAAAIVAVKSLIRIEQIGAQTDAVIKSTGGTAKVTRKEIDDLAGTLEELTGAEAESITTGQNMLLTFTNIKNESGKGNDVFDQTTKTLLDMATAMNGGVAPAADQIKQQAIQLGKAMNDPIKGITALTRVGVTFTEEQKKQITKMVEAGDTMGAQKLILAELNKEFGGSAEAFGQTTAGKIAILKHRFGTLTESLVAGLMPTVLEVTERISNFANELVKSGAVDRFKKKVKDIYDWFVRLKNSIVDFFTKTSAGLFIVEFFRTLIGFVVDAFKSLMETIKQNKEMFIFIGKVIGVTLVIAIGAVIAAVYVFIKVLQGIIWVWRVQYEYFKTMITRMINDWKMAIQAVKDFWASLVLLWEAFKTGWKIVVDGFKVGWSVITTTFKAGWEVIKNSAKAVLTWILNAIKSYINFWVNGFKGGINGVKSLWSGLKNFFMSAVNGWRNIFNKIGDAIRAPFKAAFNAVADFWNKTIGKMHFQAPDWVPGIGGKGFSMPKIPKLSTGIENFGGGLAYVHKGEVLANLPKGTDVIPKGKVGSGTVNNFYLDMNGVMASGRSDLRAVAKEIIGSLNEELRAKGQPQIGAA